jgi:hypothetical protein
MPESDPKDDFLEGQKQRKEKYRTRVRRLIWLLSAIFHDKFLFRFFFLYIK